MFSLFPNCTYRNIFGGFGHMPDWRKLDMKKVEIADIIDLLIYVTSEYSCRFMKSGQSH